MKKTCLMALAAGMACCAIASAKPPIEKYTGPINEAKPIAIGKAKMVNGKIVLDGAWMPYTENASRSAMIDAVAWDCFGRAPGTQPGSGYCATQCTMGNGSIDGGGRYTWSGSTYNLANTVDNMQDMQCPPAAIVDEIDTLWYNHTGGQFYQVFFFFQELLDGTCADPATFTPTGSGFILNYGVNPVGFWYSNARGLSAYGSMYTPSTTFLDPAKPFASGSYQWILASDVTTSQITLYTGVASAGLWGTGDATGEPNRPGTHNEFAYDDDNPLDGMFSAVECYSYNFGSTYPPILGKAAAFGYLRCPADFNNDGFPDGMDGDAFLAAFENPDPAAQIICDVNGDCFVDGMDADWFLAEFESQCF